MARLAERRLENVAGDFFVDSSCIDCDTCRWMAPQVFDRVGGQSAVVQQPSADGRALALQALLACPTASIGTVEKATEIPAVQASFPLPVVDRIFHCGYHDRRSFGAASYFIQRAEGNVLVDSPRFAAPLVKRLEALGGVKYLFLTHRDDVADHAKFQAHFGCDRILHEADISADTQAVEWKLMGTEPTVLAEDLLMIPVPGHTRGHVVLLYQNRVLFSGDHLARSRTLGRLVAFREACWYSWEEQIRSMERLANYRFEWILPGHGRRYFANTETMAAAMSDCIAWMKENRRAGDWD